MGKYELIATAALLCNFSSFGTLLYNVMITHNTSTLTYAWFYTNILAQVLMIIYAVLNGAYGIYIPTAFLLIGLLYMLYIKSTFNAAPSGQPKVEPKVEPKWGANSEPKWGANSEPKLDEGFIF